MNPRRTSSAPALVAALAGCGPLDTQVGAYREEPVTALYLEAENGALSGGFSIVEDDAASGARAIVPPPAFASDVEPGPARAEYEFTLDTAADYVIWGRVRSPDAIHNRFWLAVDDGDWTLWRISVGDIWYWDDVHVNTNYGTALPFSLTAGTHTLIVANAVEGMALDRLYITSQGDEPPGNDTPCDPPHSISLEGECLPSCGSLNGTACSETQCAGLPLLPAYDCAICCHVGP